MSYHDSPVRHGVWCVHVVCGVVLFLWRNHSSFITPHLPNLTSLITSHRLRLTSLTTSHPSHNIPYMEIIENMPSEVGAWPKALKLKKPVSFRASP